MKEQVLFLFEQFTLQQLDIQDLTIAFFACISLVAKYEGDYLAIEILFR